MGKTLVEKEKLSKKVGHDVRLGEVIIVDLDFVALHDGSGPLAVRLMKKRGWNEVFDPRELYFVLNSGRSLREKALISIN